MCYTCAGGVVGVVLRFSAVDELKLSQCWIPTEIEPRRMPKASGDVSRLRALCALLMGDKMRRISRAEALELPQCCICAEMDVSSHNALQGCVQSLRTSMQLLDSSINILDSGVSDYPRLSKVLQTTRVRAISATTEPNNNTTVGPSRM